MVVGSGGVRTCKCVQVCAHTDLLSESCPRGPRELLKGRKDGGLLLPAAQARASRRKLTRSLASGHIAVHGNFTLRGAVPETWGSFVPFSLAHSHIQPASKGRVPLKRCGSINNSKASFPVLLLCCLFYQVPASVLACRESKFYPARPILSRPLRVKGNPPGSRGLPPV